LHATTFICLNDKSMEKTLNPQLYLIVFVFLVQSVNQNSKVGTKQPEFGYETTSQSSTKLSVNGYHAHQN
jgi:hypothetical protein